ncbi:MAG: hypothetical protein J2P57_00955 [Acidimicrobiaceae bacterium]|nr:hypothetical protein [Acidimicrobiaceae bacterium]
MPDIERKHAQPEEAPQDALELWELQDRMLGDLFEKWEQDTDSLIEADSVHVRWERGSAVKLLLQHLAVREAAMQAIETGLERRGHDDLARRVDRAGVERRTEIARLDELVRGKVGMNTNIPEVDEVVLALAEIFKREARDDPALVAAVDNRLGREGRDDLPSARYVRIHSPTYPSPTPRWYDRIGPVKALRALYDHLRGSPAGVRAPGLDSLREQTPALRSNPGGAHVDKRDGN